MSAGILSRRGRRAMCWGIVLAASLLSCRAETVAEPKGAITTEGVRAILLNENTTQSARDLMIVLDRMDETHVERVAQAFRQNAAVTPDWQVVSFLHAWTDLNPTAALAEVQSWKFPFRRRFGAREVTYRWAWKGNPVAARESVMTIEEASVRLEAMKGLVQGWSRADLAGVNAFLASYDDIDLRDDLALEVARSVQYVSGFDGLRAWADAVPALPDAPKGRKFKRTVYHAALRYGANVDPAAAALWMDEHAAEFHGRNTLAIVATEWMEHDPIASIAWLRSKPASNDRNWALSRAIRRWLDSDFSSGEAWLLAQDEGTIGSDALAAFSSKLLTKKRFEDAVLWAGKIKDPAIRRRHLIAGGSAWSVHDIAGARVWLEAAPLDASAKEEIRQRAQKRGGPGARGVRRAVPR